MYFIFEGFKFIEEKSQKLDNLENIKINIVLTLNVNN